MHIFHTFVWQKTWHNFRPSSGYNTLYINFWCTRAKEEIRLTQLIRSFNAFFLSFILRDNAIGKLKYLQNDKCRSWWFTNAKNAVWHYATNRYVANQHNHCKYTCVIIINPFRPNVLIYFNPIVPNGPFFYPLKTLKNGKVFYFQGGRGVEHMGREQLH